MLYVINRIMFFTELAILIRSNKPEHSGGDGGLQWVDRKMSVKVSGKLQRRLEEKIRN